MLYHGVPKSALLEITVWPLAISRAFQPYIHDQPNTCLSGHTVYLSHCNVYDCMIQKFCAPPYLLFSTAIIILIIIIMLMTVLIMIIIVANRYIAEFALYLSCD